MQETPGFDPWVDKIPWRREWQPTPIFLLGNPTDRGAWRAAVHRVTKSQTRLKGFSTQPQSPASCPHLSQWSGERRIPLGNV